MATQTAQHVNTGCTEHEHKLQRRDAHSIEGNQTPNTYTTHTTPSQSGKLTPTKIFSVQERYIFFDTDHPEEYTQPTPKHRRRELEKESGSEQHSGMNVHAAPFVSTNTFHSGNSSTTTHSAFAPNSTELPIETAIEHPRAHHESELPIEKHRTQTHNTVETTEGQFSDDLEQQHVPSHADVTASKTTGIKDKLVGGVKKVTGKAFGSESLKTKGQTQIEKGKEEITAAKKQKKSLSPHFAKERNNGMESGATMREQEERNFKGVSTEEANSGFITRQPLTPRENHTESTQPQLSPRQKHTYDAYRMTPDEFAKENIVRDTELQTVL